MVLTVDLNADLGEGVTDDEALLAIVTSANVACGFHAGDASTMENVCRIAVERSVVIGAQVSYLDREGFGRRDVEVDFTTLVEHVSVQVTTLQQIAESVGGTVAYVKPHGALYNRVVHDAERAAAVLEAAAGLPVMGLPGSVLLDLALARGNGVVREGFPDRGYTTEGRLIARGEPGALVSDAADIARRAVDLAAVVDSVCVHGDSPGAVAAALAVRRALESAGYLVRPHA